jgi:hypothetical protein
MTTVNYSNILRQPIYTTLQYTTVDMITKISKTESRKEAELFDETMTLLFPNVAKNEYFESILESMK